MATVNTETGEIIEDDEPTEEETVERDEPAEDFAPHDGTRCEEITIVAGTHLQCSLDEGHEGDHSYQPVERETYIEPTDDSREQTERIKKLRERADRYSKSVVDLLGDDLDGLIACELCSEHGFPGLRFPLEIPAETKGKLRVLIGLPSLDNFRQANNTETCPVCQGLGKVLTGSQIERYATITCQRCEGYGYMIDGIAPKNRPQVAGALPEPESLDAERADEPTPEVDPWGRPKGDPDYGRMPGYEA